MPAGPRACFEADELAQAHRNTAELEAELEAVKAAVALFSGRSPSDQRAMPGCPRPEQSGLQRATRVGNWYATASVSGAND